MRLLSLHITRRDKNYDVHSVSLWVTSLLATGVLSPLWLLGLHNPPHSPPEKRHSGAGSWVGERGLCIHIACAHIGGFPVIWCLSLMLFVHTQIKGAGTPILLQKEMQKVKFQHAAQCLARNTCVCHKHRSTFPKLPGPHRAGQGRSRCTADHMESDTVISK